MSHDQQVLKAMKNLNNWLYVWQLNTSVNEDEVKQTQAILFENIREDLTETISLMEKHNAKLVF